MKNSKREEIVSHSAKKLFNIVLDIQSYPEYIPWCTKMVVNEKKSDEIFADMYVKYKFILTQKFGSHVKFNKKELTIQTSYLEGPLKLELIHALNARTLHGVGLLLLDLKPTRLWQLFGDSE